MTELQCWELACIGVSHVNNNTKVLTWHSEQSSNWQRFFFLMILSFQIFILWVFCRLQRITHIHSSCICCAMGAFSLFFFVHPSVHSGQQSGNTWLQNGVTANNSAFGSCFSCFLDKVLVSWRAAMLFPHYQTDSVWKSNIPFTWKRKL